MQNDSLRLMNRYVIVGVLFWMGSALVAGWLGLFSQPGGPPTLLGLFIALPIAGCTTLYIASGRFRVIAHSIPLPLIIGAHLWRYVGLGFLIAWLYGKLPPQFGIPEGIGDVVAAVFALPLALAVHRGRPIRKYCIAWNIFGLADLVSAISVGVLYSQGSFGVLRTGVSTGLMTTFPVNLIPTFFVPLFIMLHVLALLRRNEVEITGARAPDSTVGHRHFRNAA